MICLKCLKSLRNTTHIGASPLVLKMKTEAEAVLKKLLASGMSADESSKS